MEDAMRNAVYVFIGMMLATTIACGGDDEGGEDDNMFDNPAAGSGGLAGTFGGGGTSGLIGGGTSGGLSSGCADGIVRTSRVTPRVILLLDGSCSMSSNYPSDGQSARECVNNPGSRWSALRNALLDPAQGVVTRLAGAVEFGLVVYGTQPNCPLTGEPIMAQLDNLNAIQGALGEVPPGMFTPTGAALDYVYRNLIEPVSPDSDMGPQIVVLATDGEPNSCDDAETDYQPSLQASELGRSMGITTYVVSLAGAQGEFHEHLQQLANLGKGFDAQGGQMATLYEPSTPEALAADLELLIGGAVGCDVALNGEVNVNAACQGTVTLNEQPVACNDPNGWVLIDPRHIRLQGAACEQLKNDNTISLKADFPCSIFDPQ
jgi:hypothetical protein